MLAKGIRRVSSNLPQKGQKAKIPTPSNGLRAGSVAQDATRMGHPTSVLSQGKAITPKGTKAHEGRTETTLALNEFW